jgi:hypothetical protein
MQDMMKNFMGDMWKGVGDMKAENWMKDLFPIKDMDPKKIGLQVLGFQKNAFDTIYNAMQQTQQQVEKLAEPLLENIPGVPAEWQNMLKKNQDDMKKSIDEGFAKAESFFSPTSSPVKEAKPTAEKTKAKAEPKTK